MSSLGDKVSKWLRIAIAILYLTAGVAAFYVSFHYVLFQYLPGWKIELALGVATGLWLIMTGYWIFRRRKRSYWFALVPFIAWKVLVLFSIGSPFWDEREDGTLTVNLPLLILPLLVFVALSIIKKRELTK